MSKEAVVVLITDEQVGWTSEPHNILPNVSYMHDSELIENTTDSMNELDGRRHGGELIGRCALPPQHGFVGELIIVDTDLPGMTTSHLSSDGASGAASFRYAWESCR